MIRKEFFAALSAVVLLVALPAYADDVSDAYGVAPLLECPDVTQPPTLAEVVLLLKCHTDHDVDAGGQVARVSNIQVKMGKLRRTDYNDPNDNDLDDTVAVTPIRGSFTVSICSAISDYMQNQGKNCTEVDFAGNGVCYQTSMGDWKCILSRSRVATRANMPPPP